MKSSPNCRPLFVALHGNEALSGRPGYTSNGPGGGQRIQQALLKIYTGFIATLKRTPIDYFLRILPPYFHLHLPRKVLSGAASLDVSAVSLGILLLLLLQLKILCRSFVFHDYKDATARTITGWLFVVVVVVVDDRVQEALAWQKTKRATFFPFKKGWPQKSLLTHFWQSTRGLFSPCRLKARRDSSSSQTKIVLPSSSAYHSSSASLTPVRNRESALNK